MGSRHERTLRDVFAEPTRANIQWTDIERMLESYGASKQERAGSRVAFTLNGVRAVFHRPHPEKEAGKAQVRNVRDFCVQADVIPEDQ